MPVRFLFLRSYLASVGLASALWAGSGYDSAGYPPELASRLGVGRAEPTPAIGTCLRVRGFPNAPLRSPSTPERDKDIAVVRAALIQLRSAGYRTTCVLRWDRAWPSGARRQIGGGNRAPLDLREAYSRARAFAETYGDVVDAWEFENEPDIGFFADNGDVLAAYYKAVAVGFAHGRQQGARSGEQGARNGGTASADGGAESDDLRRETLDLRGLTASGSSLAFGLRPPVSSVVVMPAMCLPPGPYLEQLVRNGLVSYTEGVNLHFYGFAEDYGAAHDRLREALTSEERGAGSGEFGRRMTEDGRRTQRGSAEMVDPKDRPRSEAERVTEPGALLAAQGARRWTTGGHGDGTDVSGFRLSKLGPSSAIRLPSSSPMPTRQLPVFATEWGYPRLDGVDAQTVEGRVRQWRFFRDVQQENRRRAVAAPMAFYLAPYFEAGAKEFGLPMPPDERRAAHYGFEVPSSRDWAQKVAEVAKAGVGQIETGGRTKPRGEDGRSGGSTPKRSGAGDRAERPLGGGGSKAVDGGRTTEAGERRTAGEVHLDLDLSGTPSSGSPSSDIFKAGGLAFSPSDFNAASTEPWLRRIGEKIGDGEASPALAWLMEEGAGSVEQGAGRQKSESRKAGHFRSPVAGHRPPAWFGDWSLRAEAPSPVVIDFVAGEGAMAVKNYNGYLLSGQSADAEARSGAGKLVLYNFDTVPAEVRLAWVEGNGGPLRSSAPRSQAFDAKIAKGREESPTTGSFLSWARSWRLRVKTPVLQGIGMTPSGAWQDGAGERGTDLRITLAPGERREVPVELRVPGERFTAHRIDLAADVRCGTVRTRSRWSSLLYPMPDRHQAAEGRSFFFPSEAAKENRRWLEERPHATEELRLQDNGGRWRTTPGVAVEETATGWRIHVATLPGAYLSPAVAELPLPDDWEPWEQGLVLSYNYRIAPASFALRKPLRPDAADATQRLQTGKLGDMIESYLRTRTGAVYSTVPRLTPTPVWQRYNQPSETLTPHFPGRLAAPLKVARERPAALVFYLRPMALPTVFEIERPALAHWVVTDGGR